MTNHAQFQVNTATGFLTADPELASSPPAAPCATCAWPSRAWPPATRPATSTSPRSARTPRTAQKYLHKGSQIGVDGRLEHRTWGEEGNRRQSYTVIGQVTFLDRPRSNGETTSPAGRGRGPGRVLNRVQARPGTAPGRARPSAAIRTQRALARAGRGWLLPSEGSQPCRAAEGSGQPAPPSPSGALTKEVLDVQAHHPSATAADRRRARAASRRAARAGHGLDRAAAQLRRLAGLSREPAGGCTRIRLATCC